MSPRMQFKRWRVNFPTRPDDAPDALRRTYPLTMPDSLTPEERSSLMSKVRSGDTKPEWILRTALHRMGFRYSLRNRSLPGSPDLVFPKFGAVIFVHGCYWHFHRKGKCKRSSLPKSNRDFWIEKFGTNRKRDRSNVRKLRHEGWRVMTVWECELIDETIPSVEKVAAWLSESEPVEEPRKISYLDPSKASLERRDILRVAEGKVRKRIDGYGE